MKDTTIFDVAKYILEKSGKMSIWKLQKLCYYAQAWVLAWQGVSLFDEDFEAWSNGPVCPALFKKHQGKFSITSEEFLAGDANNLNDDQKESIDVVINDYGKKEPYELRELSHMEDPWKIARGELKDGEPSDTVITKESIISFYRALIL